jgi:hypothetical protein
MILCYDTFIAAERLPRALDMSDGADQPLRSALRA